MRSMLTMGTELLDKGFLNFVKDFHLMNRLSLLRVSGLEPEAPAGAMLPNIKHLLNTVKIGKDSRRRCHQECLFHLWM